MCSSGIPYFSVQYNTLKTKCTVTCPFSSFKAEVCWKCTLSKSNELDSLSVLCRHGWAAPNWLINKSLVQVLCHTGAGIHPCVQQHMHVNMQPHRYAQTLSSSGLQLHCSFSATHACIRPEQPRRNYRRNNRDDETAAGCSFRSSSGVQRLPQGHLDRKYLCGGLGSNQQPFMLLERTPELAQLRGCCTAAITQKCGMF